MNLINRYIIFEIVKFFVLTLIAVLCIFIAIDYLGTMDEFIDSHVSLLHTVQYVVFKIPFVTTQAMPVILLMAILIAFGLMSKNNELIILNASGISIYTLVRPVLIISAAAAMFLFYLTEHVVPLTMQQSNAIKQNEIRKAANVNVKAENIWIKGQRRITHIKYFDPSSQAVFGLTRYFFDSQFRLVRRIDAKKAEYQNGRWILHQCMDQHLNAGANIPAISLHDTLTENLELEPEDFSQIAHKSEEMNFRQLLDYIHKVESEGYTATVYRVDLNAKCAYPFVCVVMALVGIGLTARKRLDMGLPVSISYGIGIGFLYWIFQSICISLGYRGTLPPVVAAWTANFVFFCGGSLLIMNAE
jgi:lipopolysaccharide export system permease protein